MSEAAIDYGDDEVQDGDVEEVESTNEGVDNDESAESADNEGQEVEAPKEPAPITFSPEQQEFINKSIVAKQVAKRGEAEREAQELRQRLEQYETQKQGGEPSIPDMPTDIFSDDYQEKMQARERAIAEHAEWRVREEQRSAWEQHQTQQQQREQMEAVERRVADYTTRAKDLGISEADLAVAGNAVGQIGIHQDVAEMLIGDEVGPAVTVYLSQHVQELAQMQQMTPLQAAIHIDRNIKPKVSRKKSRPPAPTETVEGSAAPEGKRGPKGAVYE